MNDQGPHRVQVHRGKEEYEPGQLLKFQRVIQLLDDEERAPHQAKYYERHAHTTRVRFRVRFLDHLDTEEHYELGEERVEEHAEELQVAEVDQPLAELHAQPVEQRACYHNEEEEFARIGLGRGLRVRSCK